MLNTRDYATPVFNIVTAIQYGEKLPEKTKTMHSQRFGFLNHSDEYKKWCAIMAHFFYASLFLRNSLVRFIIGLVYNLKNPHMI